MTSLIRIAIADDDDMVRSALRRYLAQEPDLHFVGEAADGDEAVVLVQAVAIDVLLLDVAMPQLDGLQALPRIRAAAPATRVLMLSSHADHGYQQRSMENGACGYLLKGGHPHQIVEAIRNAMTS